MKTLYSSNQKKPPCCQTSVPKHSRLSQLIQLKLQTDILRTIRAVVSRKAAARDGAILAHISAPRVVGVACQQPVGAELDAVAPQEVGAAAEVR